jgi:hypothetical protein
MKHPYSEEILSAYVDGELTDQERAQVEHWLESSPGARERLEDFRGLSRLFASLPRTEVPQEFPTKILQLAERRMLLPEAQPSSTKRRRWILGAGASLMASAAGLLICLLLQFRDPAPGNLGVRNPPPGPGHQAPRGLVNNVPHGATDHEGRFVAAGARGQLASGAGVPSAAPLPAESSRGAGGQGLEDAAGGSTPAPADRSPQTASLTAGSAGGGVSREEIRAYPQLAQINQAIDEIRRSGDDEKLFAVVRVKMRVVDRANGMLLLQRVFIENHVVADDPEAGLVKSENGAAAKRSIAKPGSAIRDSAATANEALYVVAEPDQFLASFKTLLDSEDAPVRLSVESPLEIAALNPESQKRWNELNRSFLHSSLRQPERATSIGGDKGSEPHQNPKLTSDDASAADKAKADLPLPAPPGATGKNASQKPGEGKSQSRNLSQPKEMPDSAEGGALEKEAAGKGLKQGAAGPARQFVVPVPRELEERQSRAATTARRTAPEAPASDVPAPPAPSANRADNANVDGKRRGDGEQARRAPTLVQVLIVIELDTATPAAPAIQPAAGKGPGGA